MLFALPLLVVFSKFLYTRLYCHQSTRVGCKSIEGTLGYWGYIGSLGVGLCNVDGDQL